MEDLVTDGNGNIPALNINTSDCRVINKVHKNQEKVIWRESTTEMDNHADTHCFGANFLPISFTLEDCNVSPFIS